MNFDCFLKTLDRNWTWVIFLLLGKPLVALYEFTFTREYFLQNLFYLLFLPFLFFLFDLKKKKLFSLRDKPEMIQNFLMGVFLLFLIPEFLAYLITSSIIYIFSA